MRVTATKCDGCGTILTGYIRDGWMEIQLKKMPEIENRADFCPECAPKVLDAIREWFPNLNVDNRILRLTGASMAVHQGSAVTERTEGTDA